MQLTFLMFCEQVLKSAILARKIKICSKAAILATSQQQILKFFKKIRYEKMHIFGECLQKSSAKNYFYQQKNSFFLLIKAIVKNNDFATKRPSLKAWSHTMRKANYLTH